MKYLLLSFSLLFSAPSFAINSDDVNNAGFSKLSDTQKAEIIQEIEKRNPTQVDALQQWANLGESLGKGLASTARELGVATNEFAQSPVGKIAILLLVWNFLGKSVTLLLAGVFFAILSTYFSIKVFKNQCRVNITYSKDKTNLFGQPKVEHVSEKELDVGQLFMCLVCFFVLNIPTFICLANV